MVERITRITPLDKHLPKPNLDNQKPEHENAKAEQSFGDALNDAKKDLDNTEEK